MKGALGLLGAARQAPGSSGSLSASGRGPGPPGPSHAPPLAPGTAAFKFDSESWSEFKLLPVPISGRSAAVTVAAAVMILRVSGRRAPPDVAAAPGRAPASGGLSTRGYQVRSGQVYYSAEV